MNPEDNDVNFDTSKYDDVYEQVLKAKQNDPGMFISNWEDDNDGICSWTKNEIASDPHKQLITEAEHGNLDAVMRILEDPMVDINAQDNDGYRALHRACYSGHSDLASYLIMRGAHIDAPTAMGWTPLHSAVHWNMLDCVKVLLAGGANVNAVTEGGQTPLHLACSKADVMPEIVALLLACPHIRTDLINGQGDTCHDLMQRYTPLAHFFYPFQACCTALSDV